MSFLCCRICLCNEILHSLIDRSEALAVLDSRAFTKPEMKELLNKLGFVLCARDELQNGE